MVKDGDIVEEGEPLLVLEAMKMEHTLRAPRAGVVADMAAVEGRHVADGHTLLAIRVHEEAEV